MKGKYITIQILLACLKKPAEAKKDIHTQLAETIAERKEIMQQYEKVFLSIHSDIKETEKDIHAQLRETITEYRATVKKWKRFFPPAKESNIRFTNKKAA